MELSMWLALVGICLMGAMSPGPSLAVVLKHCLASGRTAGIITALSHGFGVGVYALIAVLGLGALIHQWPMLYTALIYGGAAYLVYLAINSWRSSAGKLTIEATQGSYKKAATDGFAIAFLNPKLAIFFIALFSQFIPAEQVNTVQGAVMVATPTVIDASWYVLVALLCSHGRFLPVLERNQVLINRLLSVAFMGLALMVVARQWL
ncbi:LysE family translocator [Pseudoalteromonas sp. MM17-2]|uniref:LysE family translocator n=1 Tax=Pseudoalteromonas sp. MM17-2 TaxID=2917753 RepID=UPI001EF5EBFF|nr:LysE family translocator [Pseudoalteromonas sp. MM17-2]MCG7543555.1 LysE family translocator [Pseudoalteromonas sp. MM17-2]